VNDLAIRHDPRPPYAYPLRDERLRVRLRTALDDPRWPLVEWSDRQDWQGADLSATMRWLTDDERFRYWEADVTLFEGRVRYTFRLDPPAAERSNPTQWVGDAGVGTNEPGAEWPDGYFHWPYVHPERLPRTPAWLRDAIAYEIMPERFARGDPPIAPEQGSQWPGEPTHDAFWGGDLAGIVDRVNYVQDLGVNLVWLTPIFAAPSNHKYDTADYGRIDPHFGDEALFARLVETYQRRGIRILLDGVFNHSGAQFAPWQDVLRQGSASPYWGWFDIRGARPDPPAHNYRTFAHTGTMPRLRTANPEVQAYLIAHALRWTRMGIAGWRLDVADEVDMSFWRAFRREVRAANPEAYLVGEIAYDAARWLEGDQFDGVMNYPLRRAMLQFFAPPHETTGAPPTSERLDARGFLAALGRLRSWYPGWAHAACLNPLSTHDVPRFLTACGDDERRWALGLTFLLAHEGVPLLYYGDEIGLGGGYDPACRRPMVWAPERQHAGILTLTRQLTRLRAELPALRAAGMRPIASGSPDVAAFLRGGSGTEEIGETCPEGAAALVVLSRAEHSETVALNLAARGVQSVPAWPAQPATLDLLSEVRHDAVDGSVRLTLPPFGAAVLVPDGSAGVGASFFTCLRPEGPALQGWG
jgi:cyclomaltodextrinase / maltogenic alpha-amylase / neopullulanase